MIDNNLKYHMFDDNGNGVNFLTGAGFSIYAKNKYNIELYIGSTLIDKLKTEILHKCTNITDVQKDLVNDSNNLSEICTFLKEDKVIIDRWLLDLYTISDYNECYDILPKIKIKHIITTNIDNLLEVVYRNTNIEIENSMVSRIPEGKNRIQYYKIHGDIKNFNDSNGTFVFSIGEIDVNHSIKEDHFNLLRQKVIFQKQSPLVIIGNSISDSTVRQQLFTILDQSKELCPVYYIDNNIKNCSKIKELYKNFNITTYCMDTKEFLLEIAKYQPKQRQKNDSILATGSEYSLTNILKKEKLRTKGSTIKDIYLGTQLLSFEQVTKFVQTEYLNKSTNHIMGSKNLIITGFPCSGKTYLLKQIAMELQNQYNQQVYYIDGSEYIGEKEFKLLVIDIKDKRDVIVLIDSITLCENFPILQILSENKIRWCVADLWQSWGSNHLSKDFRGVELETISKLSQNDQIKYRKFLEIITPHKNDRRISNIKTIYDGVKTFIFPVYKKSITEFLTRLDDSSLKILVGIMYMTLCKTKFNEDLIIRILGEYNQEKVKDIHNKLAIVVDYMESNNMGYYQFYQNDTIVAQQFFGIISQEYIKIQDEIISTLNKTSPMRISNYKAFSRQCRKSETLIALFNWNYLKAEKHIQNLITSSSDKIQNAHTHHQYAIYLNVLLSKESSFQSIPGIKKTEKMDIGQITDKCIKYITRAYEIAPYDFSIKNTYARLIFDINYEELQDNTKFKIRKLFECVDILKACIYNENMRLGDKHIKEYCLRILDLSKNSYTNTTNEYEIHKKIAKELCETEIKNDLPNFVNNEYYKKEFLNLADEISSL